MSKQIKSPSILLISRDLIAVFVLKIALIFFLVEKEIVLCRIIRPDILYALIYLAIILKLFEILNNFKRCSRTRSIINQLVFGRRPWSIFQSVRKFKCPIHDKSNLKG